MQDKRGMGIFTALVIALALIAGVMTTCSEDAGAVGMAVQDTTVTAQEQAVEDFDELRRVIIEARQRAGDFVWAVNQVEARVDSIQSSSERQQAFVALIGNTQYTIQDILDRLNALKAARDAVRDSLGV